MTEENKKSNLIGYYYRVCAKIPPATRKNPIISITAVVIMGICLACWARYIEFKPFFIPGGSPPWLLLTGLVTAPALLLTWYWRHLHKERDIELTANQQAHEKEKLEIEKKNQEDKLAQENNKLEIEKNLQEERLATDRFINAVKLLGDEKMEIRLGGIYALERIANDYPKDHWTVMETLSAYVRNRAPAPVEEQVESEEKENQPKKKFNPPIDIQAIITVIGRRKWRDKEGNNIIDLSNADLRGVKFSSHDGDKSHFEKVNFNNSHLEGADLRWANLEFAKLEETNLENAILQGVTLKGADLNRAQIKNSDLTMANLELANLEKSNLDGANLSGVRLNMARLSGSHLGGADLESAHLEGASLFKAHLEGAKLGGAHLEGAGLIQALYSLDTNFPTGFNPITHGMILVGDDGNPVDPVLCQNSIVSKIIMLQ